MQSSHQGAAAALKAFAAGRKLRVTKCAVFAPTVMETYEVQTRLKTNGVDVRLYGSASYLLIEARVTSVVWFSIGGPNSGSSRMTALASVPGIELPIYVASDTAQRDAVTAWFGLPANRDLVRAFQLKTTDRLETFSNGVTLLLRPTGTLSPDIIERVVTFAHAVQNLTASSEPPDDAPALPSPLRELLRTFAHLAETDDVRRDDIRDGLTNNDKKQLLARIQPLFPEINRYLQTHEASDSATVRALGALAELASELLAGR